jgi:hypothetical protein
MYGVGLALRCTHIVDLTSNTSVENRPPPICIPDTSASVVGIYDRLSIVKDPRG